MLRAVIRKLDELRPFITEPGPLRRDITALASLAGWVTPVARMALLRMDERGNCREYAETGAPGDAVTDEIKEWAAALSTAFAADGSPAFVPVEAFAPGAAAFPLWYDSRLVGLILLARGQGELPWTAEDAALLRPLLSVIALAFTDKQHFEHQEMYALIFNTLMDNINAGLYVTDIKTDRILFMNRTMKRDFGIENPEGQLCWKILQKDRDHRCEFCPVQRLLRQGEGGGPVQWEEVNGVTGRTYDNYDTLIRWVDGSLVHLQHSMDITASRRLSRAASTDELTDMLNRRAGKETAVRLLEQARQEHKPLTIALFDINVLKEVNDAFGHGEGDRMITAITDTLKKGLRPQDIPFRLSGDEFVVLIDGTEQEAADLLDGVLDSLRQEKQRLGLPYDLSFCYGVLEAAFHPAERLSELLAQVDERMYEQKRAFHRVRAERAHRVSVREGAADFSYDKDRLYSALVQSTDDYLYICNMRTGVFRYPQTMVEEFDLPGQVIRDALPLWRERVHENDWARFIEANEAITEGRAESHSVEYRARNRRGEWIWLRCRGHVERDESGEPVLFAGIITNLGRKNKLDHMTGLFNKFEMEEVLRSRITGQAKRRMGLIILDLDDFKHINDLYNREFGDEVLRLTAQKIQGYLPAGVTAYRLDGDEFGLVFDNGGRDEMQRVYAAIRGAFRYQQECDGRKYYCTLSAGCAVYPDDADSYLDLFKYAGYSLEYAKNRGKNRAAFFSREILVHKSRALELTELLRYSMEHDYEGFELYYQPQVRAGDGVVIGAEALARWRCDAYGSVSPAEFIPLLEQSGLIVPAGRWIFRQAVRTCRLWVEKHPGFVMSVNLSYLQVTESDFIPFMKAILAEEGVNPANMVVELTESYLVKGDDTVRRIFDEIRQLGIRIAMDDFGTGYSSLGILKKTPADIVKIDKTFIRDIRESHFDATFIRFIVALCHDVGIEVCLEGVESDEEYGIVSPMELDIIQGYLFGRPVPADVFQETYL